MQLASVVKSMLLPHGYPASVAPQFAPYMLWRGSQYFFGCALSPRHPPPIHAFYCQPPSNSWASLKLPTHCLPTNSRLSSLA